MRPTSPPASPGVDLDDGVVLRALKDGDERVFTLLVDRWGAVMLHLALAHVGNRAVAEEVVQDAWLTVLRSLDRFEGRSAFRTWVLGIVINIARARARAERRGRPVDADGAAVEAGRFLPADHPRWPRHWAREPVAWGTPEQELLAGEASRLLLDAIDGLPPAQREVLVLRDIQGTAAAEVCSILGITDTHQRVLLHRARSRVRGVLERYLATEARDRQSQS